MRIAVLVVIVALLAGGALVVARQSGAPAPEAPLVPSSKASPPPAAEPKGPGPAKSGRAVDVDAAFKQLDLIRPAKLKPVNDFTLPMPGGKTFRLADYHGKMVFLNFWATWCEPCREEIPWLIQFQNKYSAKGFTVLGIAVDEEGKKVVQPYVLKERFDVNGTPTPMNYPILIGNDSIGDKFGGLIGYPTSVLISRDGRIVRKITGIINEEELSKTIEKLL